MITLALGGALVWCGAAPAGFAWAQDAAAPLPAQVSRPDAQVQGDVLKQLATAPGLTGQTITASTSNGVVTLSGSVTDEVMRQLAENAVSSVAGVKSVENRLKVGDLPATNPVEESAQASGQDAPPVQQAAPSNNGWGPAGPPPDAVNGQIPTPPQQQQQGTAYGPPMGAAPSYPQYPPQQQYPNSQVPSRPQYRPGYQSGYQPAARPYVPSGPVTLPAGTLLTVRIEDPIDARHVQVGDVFVVNAARDVFENGVLAVPLGATLEGHVVFVKKPGAFAGGGEIQVELTQLDLDGRSYPVGTDIYSTYTPGKGGQSAANTVGGALFGAILGGAIGGGSGAAVGAVAGGAGGAALSTAEPAPRSFIPAETLITFHLKAPATFQPVSPEEATRLAASMPRPVLRPRPVYYAPRPVYYPYPY